MVTIQLKKCVFMFLIFLTLVLTLCGQARAETSPLQVCVTTPDLASLVREVGGDRVAITVFAKPTEDPHFVEAKPGFIKALNGCDLYVQTGLELELGWAPVLLENARNGGILPGSAGFLDASTAIAPLEIPTQPVDRSMGDVHPRGNPHYLLDPLNGLKVAGLIRDKLSELQPADQDYFSGHHQDFAQRLGRSFIGEQLAAKYSLIDIEKLALLFEHGKLRAYLEGQNETALLGGWLGLMQAHAGVKAVDDHNLWPYFAHRFGVRILGHLEPKPGVPPTTRHLQSIIAEMRAEDVPVIITAPYYDPRHARFVMEQTGAVAAPLANQPGSRTGTDDYLDLIDYNVREMAKAIQTSRDRGPKTRSTPV